MLIYLYYYTHTESPHGETLLEKGFRALHPITDIYNQIIDHMPNVHTNLIDGADHVM